MEAEDLDAGPCVWRQGWEKLGLGAFLGNQAIPSHSANELTSYYCGFCLVDFELLESDLPAPHRQAELLGKSLKGIRESNSCFPADFK